MIVVDNFGNLNGFITERDMVRKNCKDIFPSEVGIKEIMSLPLVTIITSESPSIPID